MKQITKAFLASGIVLLISSGACLILNFRSYQPMFGTTSLAELFLFAALWLMLVAGLNEFSMYLVKLRLRKKKKEMFNIWKDVSPKPLALLSIAVFCIFASTGTISTLMDLNLHDMDLIRILFESCIGGAFVSAIFLLGKRPKILAVFLIIFCHCIMLEENIMHAIHPDKVPNPPVKGQITLSEAEYARYAVQYEYLGIAAMALMISGYALFLYAIGLEGKKRVQLESEILVARKIQDELLPKCEFRYGDVVINGMTIPAKEVGGDYYDCFRLSADEHLVVLADASGHGVGSGILAAMMKAALAGFVQDSLSLPLLFSKVNKTLCAITAKSQFVTAGAVKINLHTHEAEIITAGHHPVLHKTKDGIAQLRTPSLALGLSELAEYTTIKTQFTDGDVFIIYSDGIPEARNSSGEMYSLTRLEEAILKITSASRVDISSGILNAVKEFSKWPQPEDDMTVIGIQTGKLSS